MFTKQLIATVEVYYEAKKLGITQIQELEEKGFEIACVDQKHIIQKKVSSNKDKVNQNQNISLTKFESNYTDSKAKPKEQVYYNISFSKAKQNQGTKVTITKKKINQQRNNYITNNSMNSEQNKLNIQDLSFFAYLKSIHKNDFKFKNQIYDSCQNSFAQFKATHQQKEQTEQINSFGNEGSQNFQNANCFSEEKQYSQFSKEYIKINEFNSQKTPPEIIHTQKQNIQTQNSHNNQQNTTQSARNQLRILVNTQQMNLLQDDQSNQILIKPLSSSIQIQKDNNNQQDLNIFENYDTIFTKIQEEYQKKRVKQQQYEIIPITHTEIEAQQSENIKNEKVQSPIQKIKDDTQIIPKKIKSKVSKRLPKINSVLRKDSLTQIVKIKFNHPLIIFNAPDWVTQD